MSEKGERLAAHTRLYIWLEYCCVVVNVPARPVDPTSVAFPRPPIDATTSRAVSTHTHTPQHTFAYWFGIVDLLSQLAKLLLKQLQLFKHCTTPQSTTTTTSSSQQQRRTISGSVGVVWHAFVARLLLAAQLAQRARPTLDVVGHRYNHNATSPHALTHTFPLTYHRI